MSLKNNISKFRSNHLKIIKYWILNKEVESIITIHEINKETFIREYAIGVLDYYIEVVNGTKEIGNCPAIISLLTYLKEKNITADELFVICTGFKNAMLQFANDIGLYNFEFNNEINRIYEKNFAGVLKYYVDSINNIQNSLDNTLSIVDKHILIAKIDLNGKITALSDALCQISQYNKDELLNKEYKELIHHEFIPDAYNHIFNTINKGQTWKGEIKYFKKDGSSFWAYTTIEPFYDETRQNILFFDAIMQDITSEKELEDHHYMLIEQSKYAAMGEMISMIAHQWRQPLQSVSILAQKIPLLKMCDGEISDAALNKTVDDILLQLKYMSETIDDFKNYFKPNREKEYIKLSALVNRSTIFLSYLFKVEGIVLDLEVKKDNEVQVFANEFVQVLINIMKNAKDAIQENKIKNKKIIIRYYTSKEFAVIEIEDNGGGIDENIIENIFDPYFSTKSEKNGTGLGLYMSKMIIEQHSLGKITAKNTNEGALFKIEIPR